MEDQPLYIFALEETAVPLRVVAETMNAADCPVSVSVDIAGEATPEQLDALDWETAFVRWETPELHDVYLLERDVVGTDDVADQAVAMALQSAGNEVASAGRIIVMDHLRRTKTVYAVQILPALLADDDHLAWSALDVALRTLAANSEGIILAVGEGFYDEDGEALLGQEEQTEEQVESLGVLSEPDDDDEMDE
jgi:hypothetical protein